MTIPADLIETINRVIRTSQQMLVEGARANVERHPWLAVNTYVAYLKAKELCYRQMETIGHC